jgi:hypothetical protein
MLGNPEARLESLCSRGERPLARQQTVDRRQRGVRLVDWESRRPGAENALRFSLKTQVRALEDFDPPEHGLEPEAKRIKPLRLDPRRSGRGDLSNEGANLVGELGQAVATATTALIGGRAIIAAAVLIAGGSGAVGSASGPGLWARWP